MRTLSMSTPTTETKKGWSSEPEYWEARLAFPRTPKIAVDQTQSGALCQDPRPFSKTKMRSSSLNTCLYHTLVAEIGLHRLDILPQLSGLEYSKILPLEILVPRLYTPWTHIWAGFQIPELFDVVDPGTARDSEGIS